MSTLQAWLTKPRASVRIDTASRFGGWFQLFRHLSAGKRKSERPRLEVIDRLSLGGKKSLLLVSIESRRFLVALSETGVPSITRLDYGRSSFASAERSYAIRRPRARKTVTV